MNRLNRLYTARLRSWNAAVILGTLLLALSSIARAFDPSPMVGTLPSVTYGGLILTYDPEPGDSDSYWFDVNGSTGIPHFILVNNGSDCALVLCLDSSYGPGQVWDGTDPVQMAQVLQQYGFVLNGGVLSGTGASGFRSSDSGNLQGIYQVGLWIFGAILMLPIILKVRPN